MRVVVIGGGFAGMATAARLAKTGHAVTLLERAPHLGGALGRVEADGFTFDTGPTHTLLPAVVRDLFRKSGRPLERETDLVPLAVIREHRFTDGTSLSLTGGSRAAQKATFDGLSPGLGEAWVRHVDPYSTTWERLRRDFFERPWNPAFAHPDTVQLLRSRAALGPHLDRVLADPRARLVAAHPHLRDGHDLRAVPAWAGMVSYLEQNFGAWTVPGGLGVLGELMAARVATRKVTVETGTEVLDVVQRGGRAVAVRTAAGEVDADAVVCAVDPTRLPSLRRLVRRTRTTTVPDQVHLGIQGAGVLDERHGDELPGELVLHGRHDVVLRPAGSAPTGSRAVTLLSRGIAASDLLDVAAERGLDLRDQVVTRLERPGAEATRAWGGSPLGVQWRGRGTVKHRLGPTTPVPGLYAAGAHANPGASLPFAGLSAWLVAQSIGPA